MAVYRVIPPGDLRLVPSTKNPGKRTFNLISGAAWVRQKLQTRFRFVLGEWFRNIDEGVPFNEIFGQDGVSLERTRTIIREILLSVQEVTAINALDLKLDVPTRTVAVSFNVQLVSGGVLLVRQPDPAFILTYPQAA